MIHLRGVRADVVLDETRGVPHIVHWGAPLGDVDPSSVVAATRRSGRQGSLDVEAPITVLPEHGSGFPGRPGLAGHRRGGTAWSPRFALVEVRPAPEGVVVVAADPVAELEVATRVELGEVLTVQCVVTNRASTRYLLDRVDVTLPVPAHASDLLTFVGRWSREFHPVRRPWPTGTHVAHNYAGRTSHEHAPLLVAGEPGFGEWRGEVWAAHLAWSGNHTVFAECLPDGRRYVQLGELLHPGEIALEPGESYTSPEVIATYAADGLTPASWGYHRSLRARPTHPTTPRPVLLNTWEAVYFDHDTARLQELATVAAGLGVERFVLDDGWFGSRRDDTRGLGDWWVAADVYPQGLAPLIHHVRSLGMEFGIWVEPEMVNPDSDLYRAHPEWALVTPGYEPVLGRNQLVLNLAHDEAFAHVLGQLDRLLTDHNIGFVKWDMNRNHVQGSGADGAAGTHAQTLAVYRLLDELGRRHPTVEIESCSSGGARIDHEILRRTVRVWTSDCNDALERQLIQRGTSLLVPPELMGAHVGPTRSHTTGRMHSLAFRSLTALFGHFGVEWNVLDLDDRERAQLAEAIALHRRFRPLLHGGDTVRFDPVDNGADPAGHAYGVYAADRAEALVAYVQLRTGASSVPPPLRLPGLAPDASYEVVAIPLPGARSALFEPIRLTGRQLAAHGVQLPLLNPETGILLHLRRP
jgi:alpha-galactosidase